MRDQSSSNAVRGNTFSSISGAPVKLTNHADYNKVRNNKSKNSGKDAFLLEQYNPNGNPGGAVEADSLGYNNSTIGKAADRKKYVQGNRPGSSYAGWVGKPKNLAEFHEKKVGG